MKKTIKILSVITAVLLLTGCESFWADLSKKSINTDLSGIGGIFTTSVDPSTGAISPTVKTGDFTFDLMSHLPGDGTQVSINNQKSMWTASVGSTVIKINAKGGLKNFKYTYSPSIVSESVTLSFDDDGQKESVSTKLLKNEIETALILKSQTELTTLKDSLSTVREQNKNIPAAVEIAKLSDDMLYSLTATSDSVGNRLIGDEIMWRILNSKITK